MTIFNKNISRRRFIGQASCAALGSSSLLNTLVNLKALNAASVGSSTVIGGGDYKALVCFFFSGGNDSFNMLVPRDAASYNEYAATRTNQSLLRDELIPINPRNPQQKDFGLHPALMRTSQLFNDGKLSFISNIGTLIEGVEKSKIWTGESKLPLGLFSHSDQIQQWQTAFPHERSAVGWGGKVADLIKDVNDNPSMSMNLSLSGTNVFQTGNNTVEYSIDRQEGSIGIYGHGDHPSWNVFDSMRTRAINNLIDHQYDDAFKQAYVSPIKVARDNHIEFQEALSTLSPFTTQFNYDNYGIVQSFEMIAKTIALRDLLGFKRQIFFVDFGGWDHHDELLGSQQDMFYVVDQALGSFAEVLEEQGISDCVTTFGISEFGRTLTSNGNGTDHAWGGNVFVMGDDVNGGRIFGEYPSLELNNDLEIGNGVLIPTTSADEYFAELAMWFGVNNAELDTIFPNLRNFYSTGSGTPPIGFLNI